MMRNEVGREELVDEHRVEQEVGGSLRVNGGVVNGVGAGMDGLSRAALSIAGIVEVERNLMSAASEFDRIVQKVRSQR